MKENAPCEINEFGTHFYDINNLIEKDIDVIFSNKEEPYRLFNGSQVTFKTLVLETKETFTHTIKNTNFSFDVPFSRTEVGENMFGEFYVKSSACSSLPKFDSKEKALKLAKTIMHIESENKKNNIQTTRFINLKN